MAYTAQPRSKDHWSMRLNLKRPGGVRLAALVVAAVQTVLLALTASSLATGGGLYGCTSACGTAAQPVTPAFAVILGIVMLVLPLVIGALSEEWRLGVALSVLAGHPRAAHCQQHPAHPHQHHRPPDARQGHAARRPLPYQPLRPALLAGPGAPADAPVRARALRAPRLARLGDRLRLPRRLSLAAHPLRTRHATSVALSRPWMS